jgi:Tfp pilus assembly protein FimT
MSSELTEGGNSILELLLVVAILLIISGFGAWKFMEALQAVSDLLALLK